jgi:membrane dipeptidase
VSTAPLVATHSNAHALCASTRNLTDAQLDAVRDSGGLVGVNFAVNFLREDGDQLAETPIDEIVRHVDYLAERMGIEHVAFGSDFDGAVVPEALGGVTGFPRVIDALAQAGYDGESIAKVSHLNWLRVLEETWS